MHSASNIQAFFDGGCPDNPGTIGSWGYVICSPWIERSGVIRAQRVTSNIAEYTALQKLLEELARLKIKSVDVKGDSRMVVKIVNREWGHHKGTWNPHRRDRTLHGLAVACSRLLSEGGHNLNWIPRGHNVVADQLATQALHEPTPSTAFKTGSG